jgi:hypothetical protein
MVASRLFWFRSMSSPHQPGRRKDSPSAQLPLVYKPPLSFATRMRAFLPGLPLKCSTPKRHPRGARSESRTGSDILTEEEAAE